MSNDVRKVNIWETKSKDSFMFLYSYEELIKYMEKKERARE